MPPQPAVRIAMWSGPRNVSTALMRSFGSRADTHVVDEPLYAHYLERTGLAHPGAADVLAHHETDWRAVVRDLLGPVPEGKRVSYQKHMAHHLLPGIEREWLGGLRHAFLVRDPAEMLASLVRVWPSAELEDTGLVQQLEVFELVKRTSGVTPPVVDARDLLQDPRRMLGALCAALDLPFDEAMLAWEPGPRATDGIWARHWYSAVERSRGFAPYRARTVDLPESFLPLYERCRPPYEALHAARLRPS
jgi:hypothetical protein